MQRITLEPVSRAIYIDFEGNVDREPTFLGSHHIDAKTGTDIFTQYVHEDIFRSAAKTKAQCVNKSIEEAFEHLATIAYRENRIFLAWSSREKLAIETFIANEKLKEFVLSRLFDSKRVARRWKNRFHRNVTFERLPRQGRHRLSEYMNLIGYHVPSTAGPGNTGQRLRTVREQLVRRNGDYENLTAVSKGKWTKVLSHNYHDCVGMREVTLAAMKDLRTFKFGK